MSEQSPKIVLNQQDGYRLRYDADADVIFNEFLCDCGCNEVVVLPYYPTTPEGTPGEVLTMMLAAYREAGWELKDAEDVLFEFDISQTTTSHDGSVEDPGVLPPGGIHVAVRRTSLEA